MNPSKLLDNQEKAKMIFSDQKLGEFPELLRVRQTVAEASGNRERTKESPATILRKVLIALMVTYALPHAAIFQQGINDAGSAGNTGYGQVPGSSALRGKTINNNYYKPVGVSGTTLHNVNLMTGQPSYSVPLAEISAGDGLVFPISLSYSGPVRQMFDADNSVGPTSWVGYGWDFQAPFVAANFKGTVNTLDDVYICNLGPYGGGQLLQNTAGSYYVATDPTIKVTATASADGQIVQWIFQTSAGIRLIFGSTAADGNAARTLNRISNLIAASPYAISQSQTFVYRWDISRMEDYGNGIFPAKNALEFKYAPINVQLGSGKYFTRESYLNMVIHKDRLGNEIEKFKFITEAKQPEEYAARSVEPVLSQDIYETRKLTRIERYLEGSPIEERAFVFNSHLQSVAAPDFPYPKRFLDKIDLESPNPRGGTTIQDRMSWLFGYDQGSHRHFGLTTIEKPIHGKDEFVYGRPDYRNSDWTARTKQELLARHLKKPDGTDILLSSQTTDEWSNQTSCTERNCIIAASVGTHLYFEVWKNNGNYFTLAKDQDGNDLRVENNSVQKKSLRIIPWNDNFLVVDALGKQLWLYEWNGQAFIKKSNLIQRENNDGSRTPITMNGDSISVYLGSDYFVLQEYNFNHISSTTGGIQSTRFFVVRKDGDTWKDVNEKENLFSHQCGLTVPDAGDPYRMVEDKCLEFGYNYFSVSTSQNMFFLVDHAWGIILPFVKSASGNSFVSIADRFLDFGDGVQKPHYPMNWDNWNIAQTIAIGEDYFVVKSILVNSILKTRIDVMHYDGDHIRRVGGEFNGLPNMITVWPSKDYFLATGSEAPSSSQLGGMYVDFWRKTASQDASGNPSITFAKQRVLSNTGVFPFQSDVRIVAHPFAFSIELYPKFTYENNNPTGPPLGGGPGSFPEPVSLDPPKTLENNIPFAPPLLDPSGNYHSHLFQFDPSIPISTTNPRQLPSSQFEDANHKKLFNVSFSATDNLITGMSCQNTSGTVCVDNQNVRIGFSTGMMTPFAGSGSASFIRNIRPVFSPWDPAHTAYAMGLYNLSNAARIGAASMLNTDPTSGKIEFSLLQSMGQGFTQFPFDITLPLADDPATLVREGDLNFVKSFISHSNISGTDWDKPTQYDFFYLQNGLFSFNDKTPEYNTHLQSFVFPTSSVLVTRNNSPIGEGAETVHHIADEESSPIPEPFLMKAGLQLKSELHDINGSFGVMTAGRLMKSTELEYYDPQRESNWPDNEFVVRLKKKTETTAANNGSSKQLSVTYHNYRPETNMPSFVKSQVDGEWFVTQTLFTAFGANKGLPFAGATFRFANEPLDISLASWPSPDLPYSDNGALLKAVSAKEIDFDPLYPFKVYKTKVWRDRDPTLTNDELKLGTSPIHDLSNGNSLEERESIEKRDAYGKPIEIKHILNATGLEKREVFFYEGLASMPAAVVDNTFYEDAAVLTAENGSVLGATSYDSEGRWPLQPDVTSLGFRTGGIAFAANTMHSGRYSLGIVNMSGLTTDLKLKGVSSQGYDYIVSAWINTIKPSSPLPDYKPTIAVERHSADGSVVETLPALQDPVGEPFQYGKWQRYEFRLTNSLIRGPHNLFATPTSGDFLRVKIGTEDNFGFEIWRAIYVDDVVCKPSQAIATVSTYDSRGNPLSVTNNDNITSTFEYDILGNLAGTKDDKHLMFNMTSRHFPGEND